MGNEVVIEVTAKDGTAATRDEIKANFSAMQRSMAESPLYIQAINPINDAFVAQVKAKIRAISKDALQIPITPDMAEFQADLDKNLAVLQMSTEAQISTVMGDPAAYRAQVLELAQQVSDEVKEVITVVADPASLEAMKAQTVAAAQEAARAASAAAEVNTFPSMSGQLESSPFPSMSGDLGAKNATELAAAEREAAEGATGAASAEAAAAEGARVLAEAQDTAATAGRGLGAAMGPLWMVMNVAQIAMMGMYTVSGSTSTAAQDLSQQIIGLGNSAGSAAQSMLGGNATLQGVAGALTLAGTSAAAANQAYQGGSASLQRYTDSLVAQQKALGGQHSMMTTMVTDSETGNTATATQSYSVAELTDMINNHTIATTDLSQAQQDSVTKYNALLQTIPQVQDALKALKEAEQATRDAAAALGFTMTSGQTAAQNYGIGIQAAAKTLADATAGSTYLENATDKASITAGQGVQQWKQLQASVLSAGQAYSAAAAGVANAEHSVETASQAVDAARHSEEQATLSVKTAQTAYTNAVYQETQAQQAVTAARAAAQQQLISLKLQGDSAAASVDQANLSLAQARMAAAALGVNANNAQSIADTPTDQINSTNAAQIAAADALIQAQNQVAGAQNSATVAQAALNTARQQGVDNNPGVLSAEHALTQAQQGVETAAQGVTNAQYAQKQAADAVTNAEWGLHAADLAVTQAQQGEATAAQALSTATDAASRSTDANTIAGANNRQQIENVFNAYRDATGSEQIAAAATQAVGEKMGFTSDQIQQVIGSLSGLNGTTSSFSIVGTPSLNPQQLTQVGQELGMSFSQIETILPGPGQAGYQAPRRAKATGGPGGGLTWVGEQGPELVHLPYGTEVMPHANSMQRVALGDVAAPGHAIGGPVGASGALGANLPMAAQWGALATVGNVLHAMGGPAVSLPAASAVDMGAFSAASGLGGGGSVQQIPSSRAANAAIMQQVFAGFGWGSGAEWNAAVQLEMMEAGFNNLAQNPTSTAFGMGQFLDSTWAGYGIAKTADPGLQSLAMGRYINARYQDPLGALAHEYAFHWYGAGGPTSNGISGIGDGGPELVRLPNGSTVVPAANSASAMGFGSPLGIALTVDFAGVSGTMDAAMATWVANLLRTGKIKLVANVAGVPAPVKVG